MFKHFLVFLLVIFLSGCVTTQSTVKGKFAMEEKVFIKMDALDQAMQTSQSTEPAEDKHFKQSEYDYLLLTVADLKPGERVPLILALHGSGQIHSEYYDIWKKQAQLNRTMVLVPSWLGRYENNMESIQAFYRLLENVINEYPIDHQKIYVAGHSGGGMIARWLIEQKPRIWRGGIFIGCKHFSNGFYNNADFSVFPPMLFVHGWKDPKFPLIDVVESIEEMKKRGAIIQLHDYKTGVHEHRPSWNEKIFEWIDAVTTSKYPSRIKV